MVVAASLNLFPQLVRIDSIGDVRKDAR
jgi:hypothetical protein